jgi:hypothetical protein
MIAHTFRRTIPWPTAITDEGIVEYGKLIPWERFFRAERLADRPGIVRLHRLRLDYLFQGDPCVQFTPEAESAAASFLSEKIPASFREA